jgi:hypothetical protein
MFRSLECLFRLRKFKKIKRNTGMRTRMIVPTEEDEDEDGEEDNE